MHILIVISCLLHLAASFQKVDDNFWTTDPQTIRISDNFEFTYFFVAHYSQTKSVWIESLVGSCTFNNLNVSTWEEGNQLLFKAIYYEDGEEFDYNVMTMVYS